jgi:phage shock protein PspC (stress-responsive transcriptional regulator)
MVTASASGHDGPMSDTSTADSGGGFDPGRLRSAPTQMLRSRDDRYIAGVCGGLARYLSIDPVVVRVILAALTVVGGVGLVLYIAAWLLAPEEGADKNLLESHLPGSPRIRVLGWIVAGFLAVAAVVGSGPWFDWGWIGPIPLLGLAILVWVLARPRGGGASSAETTEAGAPPAAPTTSGTTTTPTTPGAPAAPPPPATPTAPDAPTTTADDTSAREADTLALETTAPAPEADTPSPDTDTPSPDADETAELAAAHDGDPSEPPTVSAADQRPTTVTAPLPPTPPPSGPPSPGPPSSGPPSSSPPSDRLRDHGALVWLTLGALVAVIGVMRLIEQGGGDIEGPVYVAASLAVVSVGMLVGTWWGNGRWLIPVGALLTVTLIGISQLPVWKLGEVREAPTRSDDVLSSYEMGAGRIELDLTHVEDLQALDGRTITIDNGVGETEVLVPDDLDVTVTAELNAGNIDLLGREANGTDVSTQYTDLDDTDPDVRIEIDQSLGDVKVSRP